MQYACAEGVNHLAIAHALRLPEPTKKYMEGKKKKRKRKNNSMFSGHYVRPRTHNVREHALRSHHKNKPFVRLGSCDDITVP